MNPKGEGKILTRRPMIDEVDPWIGTSGGTIPDNALEAGRESDGRPLYIARVHHEGGVHPGKAGAHLKGAHIGWGGQEITVPKYEELMNVRGLDWHPTTGGDVPEHAVVVGNESNGEALYAVRAWHADGLHIGKIRDGWSAASIAFGGQEIQVSNYKVLVLG